MCLLVLRNRLVVSQHDHVSLQVREGSSQLLFETGDRTCDGKACWPACTLEAYPETLR